MLDEVKRLTIQPKDIDAEGGFPNTFGQTERENLAENLIGFARHRGSWDDFRRLEIREFLNDDLFFLDEAELCDFVVNNDDGTFSFTTHLIENCHKSSEYWRKKRSCPE